MANKSVARIWAVIAGFIALSEALTWLGLGITSLLLYDCKIDVEYSSDFDPLDIESVGTLLYTVYYYNPLCGNFPANASSGWNTTASLSQAYRTWQWSVAYIVVSGTWVITSFFLIVSGISWSGNRFIRHVLPAFWLLTTLTCIVMDVVASIQYGLDIGLVVDNQTLVPLLDEVLIPSTNPPSLVEDFIGKIPVYIAVIPSVAMTLAVSRCIVLWIANVILFIGVLISTCRTKATKKSRETDDVQRNQETPPQEEFLWRGGAQQNPAYLGYDEAYDQHDPGPIPQRHSYLGDPELYVRNRNSAEIRQHQPWSYLHPLEEAPTRPMSPTKKKNETNDWDLNTVAKIPRVQYTPTAPANSSANNNKNLQPNYFHYPYQNTIPATNQQSLPGQNIYLRD